MKIAVACDHGAYEYKEMIKEMLLSQGYEVVDFGYGFDRIHGLSGYGIAMRKGSGERRM